ncbi:RND transporter [Gammaproteobacteria bacterium 42_54_T18]|nr:RND transporter [Gammaproteobacteria bacterium 42_54_T18]
MRDKLFEFVDKHPAWVILFFLAFTVVAAAGAQKLALETDYRVLFDADNPQLIDFQTMEKVYSRNKNVSLIVVPKNNNVFTAEHLAALKQLTKQSWQVPYSTRVDSLTNFQYTYAEGDNLIVDDLVPNTTTLSPNKIAQIKEIALNEPLLVDKFISKTGHISVINITVKLPGIAPLAEQPEVSDYVRDLKNTFLAEHPGTQIYLSGMIMMDTAFGEAATKDGTTLVPLMFLIVIAIIGILLRTISGTLATIVIIIMSIAATMGLAGWLGFVITGPTSSAPTMILTLAVADCIHILTSMFYEMRHGADKRTAIRKSLEVNLKPIFLTSMTTAVGFLSMNFSDVPPFRDLGNIVAMGATFAFVFSVTIFPALLTVLPIRVQVQKKETKDPMSLLASFIINKRKILLPTVSVVILVFAAFIPKNELNDDFVKYFDEEFPFRIATEFMQENLSGMTLLEISVKTGIPSGINDPGFLRAMSDFSDWLRSQPETDHVNTITDTIKRLNKNMHSDNPSWHKLPANQEMAAQYLLLYEMSLPYGLDLNNQINVDKSSSKIVATFKNMTSGEILTMEQKIYDWFKQNGSEHTIDVASVTLMAAHMSHSGISSMLIGTGVAIFVISIILGFALKSVRYGALSLLPNLLPVLVTFGVWGLLYGRIGMSMSLVSSMTLGIVVDDTVHFLSKYLHARREKNADPMEAVQYAFGNVGRALVVTTIVLVAGFTVLAQSTFLLNANMGMATAMTLFIALIIDFLFLPPLLILIDKPSQESQSNNKTITASAAS